VLKSIGHGHKKEGRTTFHVSMPNRRLDDPIREICARAVALKDCDSVDLILPELTTALRQSIERLRIRAVAGLDGRSDFEERRKTY